ncbi:LOW QUALITY PROTEIN: interleukin-1 receptor-associated kinase 1-binding protein 1-like, partial [Oculina patagonica]
ESVEEVKTSVNRRVDYVLQTLKSNHVKDFTIHKTLNQIEKLYQMEIEVVVEFQDFSKCEQVCNLLAEKLDETVRVSSPVLYHTASKLDSLKGIRQACVCAVRNAKNKALEVVQMFNQCLGPPVLIREEHYEEFVGNHTEPSRGDNAEEQLTFQQKVAITTVTVIVKIFVIFEIREKAKVRKRK